MTAALTDKTEKELKKRINITVAITCVILALTVILNVLLIVFVTEETKSLFIAINTVTDVISFCGAFAYFSLVYPYGKKIYSLITSETETTVGEAEEIGKTETYGGLECYNFYIRTDGKRILLYLPVSLGVAEIKSGTEVTVRHSGKIVVRLEAADE